MTEGTKTVLVVEDVPDERSFIATVLEDAGYRVTEACDGAEALARIDEERPDLITLDITMPEKTGVAVYRKLKMDEGMKDIPIVIVTGLAPDFERFISTRGKVGAPEGYLSKPIEHEKLLEMVRGILG